MSGPPTLPAGWSATEDGRGSVDLQVVSSGRRYVAIGAGIVAAFFGWQTVAQWGALSGSAIAPWVGLTLLPALLAIWCAVGTEVWHLERDSLGHRVGVGARAFGQSYRHAELEIVRRITTNWSRPYYRLYAVVDGRSHFLIDRNLEDLQQLAAFISFYTGWRIRPLRAPLA
jgi:hypothetical protein